ncbi:MAG: PolC-type DNA polymerase III [Lachnospiraceae bacterium]|nr:PolC-type DNA polymerase III [Lachnospiraceae bacterium]
MEGKQFLEVFPTLQLKNNLKEAFQDVIVEHVLSTKRKDFLRVYIAAERIVEKQDVLAMEAQIKQQLFGHANITVKIYEEFKLSKQYTPENLYHVYKDSILLELKGYSPIMYSMLKKAKATFQDDQMTLKLEELVPYKEKAAEFTEVLEKIFCERCGVFVRIFMEYETVHENPLRKEEEEKMQRQVAAIAAKVYGNAQTTYENTDLPFDPIADATAQAEVKTESKADVKKSDKKAEEQKKEKPGTGKSYGGGFGGQKGGFGKKEYRKKSDDPSIIWGSYDIEEDPVTIDQLVGEMGEVVIRGKLLSLDTKPIAKIEKTIVMFSVTDFTDTIMVKIFVKDDQLEDFLPHLNVKKGTFLKIKGVAAMDKFDKELAIGSVTTIKVISDFTVSRMDYAPTKRVELHCHTKMSDMDGVSEVSDIIKRAYKWGHPAIAITDHGVVQALADVFHTWCDLWSAEKKRCKEEGIEPDRQNFFKIILGVEGYLVDDLKAIVVNPKNLTLDQDYVVFDLETTGFSPVKNNIIEIGAVKIQNGKITDRFSTFVNPREPIPYKIQQLTSIRDEDVLEAPVIEDVLPQFLEFCKGCVMVAHNASFDMSFIAENCKRLNLTHEETIVDTVGVARILLPGQAKHTLDACAKTLGISLENHHRAVDDAEATAEIFEKFLPMLKAAGANKLADINAMGEDNVDAVKKLPYYHVIILAKNEIGRINLYKLVSESHLTYYNKRPKIPKSLLQKYREGLIVGSACEAGELYRAMLDGKSDADLYKIAGFYDYLEIQPLGNNQFMIDSSRVESVTSMEDIMEFNKKIVSIGEALHKPVCATCDVHFLDPEDEVYRRIIMAGKGFKDEDQAPLYLRTTEEMLAEFEYLGSDKAREVVITNTNLIADCVESIDPVRPDKSAPIIPNSDDILTKICYNKAHEIYGETLPDVVEKRLQKELNSIIKNGFAVMYIIAQKLVWKSVEDGYLVGSRGSVGSSFVANMAGITEVNSLSPHYYCAKCHYYDFESPEVRAYSGKAGCDMPDKVCPNCGEMLKKDGFDIPFETFLGFKGDKEPDIDLNFSGEYQSKAHKYTEVIFGAGQTYRAGTIGTLADKTAFGYVKNYFEERGIPKRTCEINRIVTGCTGIRRSTGQHPGGIIVLPVGEEINSFTPVQHPANDMTTDIVTTHFDYHKIDHNLLKLDILGHDDPTMIRMLQDLTGVDPVTIPLDDKDVMSLFQSTAALGITPDQIDGCPLGSMGIPEFGTDFVIQMLLDTNPQSFTDLVRISGLSHGTDVWLGNAQTLIEEGKATISTAICTRDDIMIYLIDKGVDESLSFKIMESVRKGKGLTPEMEEAMVAKDVPDWYIWSCKKIKYMFPKAHAAAYVMMAWRVAYFKVNYPLAYYAAYFSIRASGFSYELMCQGKAKVDAVITDYKARKDELSKKEQDVLKDIRLVQEMHARGYEFMPIDLYRAHSRLFQIIDGKIMPSFNSIDGMGDKAAESFMEAAKNGPFLSKDDLRERAKVSKTIVDFMGEMGLLGDIPESNQISLFDFVG